MERELKIGDVFSFEEHSNKYKVISRHKVQTVSTGVYHSYSTTGGILVYIHSTKKYPQRRKV